MSLVARHLEANGIPTVIVGSALDIVEHCGVARYLFVDFPLGNPCGEPYDRGMQRVIMENALRLFEEAVNPRTIVQARVRWSGGSSWRTQYMQIRNEDLDELRKRGEARKADRASLRAKGKVRTE